MELVTYGGKLAQVWSNRFKVCIHFMDKNIGSQLLVKIKKWVKLSEFKLK